MDEPGEPATPPPTLDARWLDQLSNVPDLISIIGVDGTILWVDERGAAAIGYTAEEMIGSSGYAYLHPDDVVPSQLAMALGLARPDGLIPVPLRYIHRDGTTVVLETWPRLVSLQQTDGSVEMVVVASNRDTRVRTEFEEVLRSIAAGDPPTDILGSVVRLATSVTAGWAAALVVPELGPLGPIGTTEPDPAAPHVLVGTLPPVLMDAGVYDGSPPWEQAAATDEVLVFSSLAAFPEPVRHAAQAAGFVAATVVPVPDPGSAVPAVLMVWCDLELSASVVPAWLGTQVVPVLEVALEQRRARAELEWAARYDSLTGLVNRNRLFDMLGRTLARCYGDEQVGILYVDLDGFKEVNDTFGHATGDQVLAAAANRFTDAVRPGDVVGRIGGDEFVVVCPNCSGADEAVAVGKRLVTVLSEPVILGADAEAQVGASVGVVLAGAEISADEALRRADVALYQAKSRGRGEVVVSEDE